MFHFSQHCKRKPRKWPFLTLMKSPPNSRAVHPARAVCRCNGWDQGTSQEVATRPISSQVDKAAVSHHLRGTKLRQNKEGEEKLLAGGLMGQSGSFSPLKRTGSLPTEVGGLWTSHPSWAKQPGFHFGITSWRNAH